MEAVSSPSLGDRTWDELWEREAEAICHDSCLDSCGDPVLPPWNSLACSFVLTFHIVCDRQALGINISQLKLSHFTPKQPESLAPDFRSVNPAASLSMAFKHTRSLPCQAVHKLHFLLLLPSSDQIVGLLPSPRLTMVHTYNDGVKVTALPLQAPQGPTPWNLAVHCGSIWEQGRPFCKNKALG